MPVLGADGERLGKVREVITDARGNVSALLVKAGSAKALLPAASFAGRGDALVTAMGEGEIRQVAQRQEADAKRKN